MPILNEAGLLQISPGRHLDRADQEGHGTATRTSRTSTGRPGRSPSAASCPTDDTQGPLAADFAKEELKAKTVFILDDKELYGQGSPRLFNERCEELGHRGRRPREHRHQAAASSGR